MIEHVEGASPLLYARTFRVSGENIATLNAWTEAIEAASPFTCAAPSRRCQRCQLHLQPQVYMSTCALL